MRTSFAFSAALVAGLAQGGAAHAQDRAEVSDPVANDASGWATFGGEMGFFVGGTAGMTTTLIVMSEVDSEQLATVGPLLGAGTLVLTIGGTVLGAWGFGELASDGGWHRHAGWGAAGILPGFMEGLALAGGILMVASPDPPIAQRLTAMGIGMVGGSALGYALFRQMSEARGSASWETVGFWAGFFTGEVTGIASGDPRWILLGAAVGGALGALVTHAIARALD